MNPHFRRVLSRLAGMDEPLSILQSPREEYRELSGAAREVSPSILYERLGPMA